MTRHGTPCIVHFHHLETRDRSFHCIPGTRSPLFHPASSPRAACTRPATAPARPSACSSSGRSTLARCPTGASQRPRRWCLWAGGFPMPAGALRCNGVLAAKLIVLQIAPGTLANVTPARSSALVVVAAVAAGSHRQRSDQPAAALCCLQIWHAAAAPHPHRAEAHHRLWWVGQPYHLGEDA